MNRQMTTIEHSGFLLVEVPDRLVTYQIFGNYITWYTDSATNSTVTTEQLPPGNYQIIGLVSQVKDRDLPYRDFLEIEKLLKSHSLEPSTTLILKKQQ